MSVSSIYNVHQSYLGYHSLHDRNMYRDAPFIADKTTQQPQKVECDRLMINSNTFFHSLYTQWDSFNISTPLFPDKSLPSGLTDPFRAVEWQGNSRNGNLCSFCDKYYQKVKKNP